MLASATCGITLPVGHSHKPGLGICRVKELESLQSQVAQNHGKELVDEQALQEMELLRQRVMQLEGQASTRPPDPEGQTAPNSALADLNAELMQEMEEVRRRVMELQVPCLTLAAFQCLWCCSSKI